MENPIDPNATQLFDIIVQLTLIEKYILDKFTPLLKKAKKVYSEKIDFTESLIEIEKDLVTCNILPKSRFGESTDTKLVLITNTGLQQHIDEILNNFYDPASNEFQYFISGPSGIGKSFSILLNVLKTRRSNPNLILVHIILSERYVINLADSFFKDVLYAFSNSFNDDSFPTCPFFPEKTGKPLIDWMLYLYNSIATKPNDYDCFYKFFQAAKRYCGSTKQIIFIVDQTNIYQRKKKEGVKSCNLITDVLEKAFCHKVVTSSSDNNEDLDAIFKNKEMQRIIFRASIEGCFTRNQIKQLLLRNCNLNCEETQLDELIETTGSIPLEVWEFCNIQAIDFDEKMKNYVKVRSKLVGEEVDLFYQKKKQIMGWEESFLEELFIRLDSNSNIPVGGNEMRIDRKYMFIKDDKLWSVSPIAKQVLSRYYTKKLIKFEENHNSNFSREYKTLYKNTNASDASLKGFLFEKLIITQLLLMKNKNIVLSYHSANKKETFSMNFSTYKFFEGDFSENTDFDDNILFIPFKFNNPFVDLFLYDKSQGKLYGFQITITIKNHKNSDTQFKESAQYQELLKKDEIKEILFVWLTDMGDIKEIRKDFNKPKPKQNRNPKKPKQPEQPLEPEAKNKNSKVPKDKDSFIIMARENKEVWIFD